MSARLRLGRVSDLKDADRPGQAFLDTVYMASGRMEGFKGGLVVYVNGVHIPIPDDLVRFGAASDFNKGGTRLGGRVHGCLELFCPPGVSLLSSVRTSYVHR